VQVQTNNTQPLIQTIGLKKDFGDLQVLQGIDQTILAGEKVVIIGPSGSGKSTFLRCLNLLEQPTGGQILFENVDITDRKTDINLVRRKMGMVFQQFNLFPHMTVLQNMVLSPTKLNILKKDEADDKAVGLLKRVGLSEKADAYPMVA
jgi:polar amino acid transport system ATP-binding protein